MDNKMIKNLLKLFGMTLFMIFWYATMFYLLHFVNISTPDPSTFLGALYSAIFVIIGTVGCVLMLSPPIVPFVVFLTNRMK